MGSFWNDKTVEPKRQFRWSLNSVLTYWTVKSVNKPVATVGEAKHNYFGHTYNYPGNVTWNDIDVTLVDPADPDNVATLAQILKVSGYNPPTAARSDIASISKAGSGNALGTIQIMGKDANGATIETWEFINPVVKSFDFGGSLAYEQEGLIELKLSFKYDYATLTTTKTSSGVAGTATSGAPSGATIGSSFWK
jgi:hypothetical protein